MPRSAKKLSPWLKVSLYIYKKQEAMEIFAFPDQIKMKLKMINIFQADNF